MMRSYLFLLISALAVTQSASADDRLYVQVPAIIGQYTSMSSAVKRECEVETNLGKHVLSAISRSNPQVQSVTEPEQAGDVNLVQVTIVFVDGYGGGGWSGSKAMTIRADLRKSGVTIGTTILKRSSRGGVFGPVSGTCAILDRVGEGLGKDVANWVTRGAAKRTGEAPASPVEPSAEAEPATSK